MSEGVVDGKPVEVCRKCEGAGSLEEDCGYCNGFGVVYTPLDESCDACGGSGKNQCLECDGKGIEYIIEEYDNDYSPE